MERGRDENSKKLFGRPLWIVPPTDSFNVDRTIDVEECDVDGGRVVLAAVAGVDDEGVPLHVLEVDLLPQDHLSSLIKGDGFPSTLNLSAIH